MGNSLQDALRKAGLVKSEPPGRPRPKRRGPTKPGGGRREGAAERSPRGEAAPSGTAPVRSSVVARSLRTRSQTIARDPYLNGARQAQAKREEHERTLLEWARACRLDDPRASRPYHFTRGRRIKRILVSEEQHRALLAGEIVIVGLQGDHLLLPRAAALELASQRPGTFVHRVRTSGPAGEGEDSAHTVPDDLVW